MRRNITLQVFLASPSDLNPERRIASEVVAELNETLRDSGCIVDLRGWEDTLPGTGRPQERINADIDTCDVFVGMIWKRYGQPTGTHDSGFEEEVERALALAESGGVPEVWILFKDIDRDLISDPGPQLSRVLEFRERAERERRFLYGTFETPEEWRVELRKMLLRFVLGRLFEPVQAIEGTARPGPPSEGEGTPLPDADEVGALLAAVARNGVAGAQALESDERRYLTARLHVLAAALSDVEFGGGDLGTHDLNALLVHRDRINQLDPRERLAILKDKLLSSDVDPGFAFLWRDNIEVWRTALVFVGATTTDNRVIAPVLDLLSTLSVSPDEAEALLEKCLTHESQAVREAAVRWIRRRGSVQDAERVVRESLSKDESAKSAAISAAVEVIGRNNISDAFDFALDHDVDLDDAAVQSLRTLGLTLSDEQVVRSRTHVSAVLRLAGLQRLCDAGQASEGVLQEYRKDPDERVRRLAYEESIRQGIAITPKEVEDAFERPLLLGSEDQRELLALLMESTSSEDLPQYVRILGHAGPHAYLQMGLRGAPDMDVSADLKDEAAALRSKLVEAEVADDPHVADVLANKYASLVKHATDEHVQAGLQVLARQECAPDLTVVEKYLTADSAKTRHLALQVYSAHGRDGDADRVLELATDKDDAVSAQAVRVALALASQPSAVVEKLRSSASAHVQKVVLAFLAEEQPADVLPLAEESLMSEEQAVREIAVAVLAQEEGVDLQAVLDGYITRPRYYYNVPALLDRLLYAPEAVQHECRARLAKKLVDLREPRTPRW